MACLTVGADYWKTVEAQGIRPLKMCDGPFGVRHEDPTSASPDGFNQHDSYPATCLPCGSAIGASWNEKLVEQAAAAVAREAKALGVDILLGPAMNHKRMPLGGRNFEYLSEDPLLTGKLAAAYVRGVQSEHIAACLKHFLANNAEFNRETIDTHIEEKTLREIYLRGFEIAVKEGRPLCVMGAYNRFRGEYCCENEAMLNGVLREEWGFDGLVISDWRAVHDRVKALRAGCDLEMPWQSDRSAEEVARAVEQNELDADILLGSVRRLRTLADATEPAGAPPDVEENYQLSRALAEESMVLLKNEGVLPLKAGQTVAVVGGRAETPKLQGGGSARLNLRRKDTLTHYLREKLPGGTVYYAEGFTHGEVDAAAIRAAAELAARCDVTVAVISSSLDDDREEHDRRSLSLEPGALELLRVLRETGRPLVVLLQNGAPVEMPFADGCAALLEMFLAGSGGEEAAAAFSQAVKDAQDTITGLRSDSQYLAKTSWYASFGGFLFIGIFLGLLFMMAAVLIIYYKQISEGYDDHDRFTIMQKVGMSRKEVHRTIMKQIRLVFFLPLAAAALHIVMALKVMVKMLGAFALTNTALIVTCTGVTLLLFAGLYFLVYTLTARTYFRLVQ